MTLILLTVRRRSPAALILRTPSILSKLLRSASSAIHSVVHSHRSASSADRPPPSLIATVGVAASPSASSLSLSDTDTQIWFASSLSLTDSSQTAIPDRPDELERIEGAGGRVIDWNGPRVLGVLSTSRSIGDHYLKPFVIPKPEIIVSKRTSADEFLILATDGLWDVVSNEVACQVVRRCLDGRIKRRLQATLNESKFSEAVNQSRAAEAAAVLIELAMARGSKDNISVVVVDLNKTRKCTV